MDEFTASFLERLLAASLQCIALAALVWLLIRLVPRLSPGTQCWLWWLVSVQALAGLVAEPIRLPWLPPTDSAAVELVPVAVAASAPDVAGLIAFDQGEPAWQLVLLALWSCGVAIMAWMTLRHRVRVRELVKGSSPCTDEDVGAALHQACAAQGIRRPPGIHLSGSIESPLLVGHLNPVLLLPARRDLGPRELDMALAHELAHLRRGDLWWGCIPALARHLFFFHPFVHLAVREYALAREADCDAAVVRSERFSRHDYGSLLLRLGTRPGADRELAVASSTFRALSRRLTMLQKTSFLPRTGALAVVALVCATGVMPLRLVAAAAADPVDADPQPATTTPAPVFTGERMSVSFDRIPTRTLLQLIAETGGRKIGIDNSVTGYISLKANDVPWDQLLDTVLKTEGLSMRMFGDTMFIAPREVLDRQHEPLMSVAFEGIPTRTLLQLIGQTSGRTIIIDDTVTGTVTLKLDNVPWEQVLDTVLVVKGLSKRMRGDDIIIAPREQLDRRQ